MIQGLKAAGIVLLVLLGLYVLYVFEEVVPSRDQPAPPAPWESLMISAPPTVDPRWPASTYICRECPYDNGPADPEGDRDWENNQNR
jgi:hypothetical protein